MIQAICPASCGELIQGYIQGGEKLISYGINLFSKVSIMEMAEKDIRNSRYRYKKAYRMLDEVFRYYGYNRQDYDEIGLKIDSQISIAKGMASSTADLVATAVAIAKYLGKEPSEEEISKLCIKIEPTDSIVFSDITLFDHLKGNFIKRYGQLPACKVLILEGRQSINTIDFRKTDRSEILKDNEKNLEKALGYFEKGIKNQDIREIGRASTISAFANQKILHKIGLEDIYQTSDKLGAYGINVAHSGSVIGILYNDIEFDKEKFLFEMKKKEYKENYISFSSYDIISGGGKIIKS